MGARYENSYLLGHGSWQGAWFPEDRHVGCAADWMEGWLGPYQHNENSQCQLNLMTGSLGIPLSCSFLHRLLAVGKEQVVLALFFSHFVVRCHQSPVCGACRPAALCQHGFLICVLSGCSVLFVVISVLALVCTGYACRHEICEIELALARLLYLSLNTLDFPPMLVFNHARHDAV